MSASWILGWTKRVGPALVVAALFAALLASVSGAPASATPAQEPVPIDRNEPAGGDRPIEAVGGGTLVSNVPDVLPFGVTGVITDPVKDRFELELEPTTNLRLEVFALEQVGERMFVGGMFNRIRTGPAEVDEGTAQNFLAAFDVNTGDFIDSCRPTLDAPVYALGEIGGRLVVGGEFTSLDGQAGTGGLTALDPATCQLADGWVGGVDRPWSGERPVVRAIETAGDQLYVAGNFSHHVPLDGGAPTQLFKAMRTDANGRVDPGWRPEVMSRGVWDLAVDTERNRVVLGGFFSSIGGEPDTDWIAAVDGATGAVVPGLRHELTHPSSGHVQGIAIHGEHLFYTGSQHYIFQNDATSYERQSGTTRVSGGDGQDILVDADGGWVYDSCHCYQAQWHPSYSWPRPSPGAVSHDVNWVAAHTLDGDFDVVDEFQPEIFMVRGDGPWALEMDSNDCLWVGGDVGQVGRAAPHWAGGFARLCRPPAPPATPTAPAAVLHGSDVMLEWPAVDGAETYAVWRDGVRVGQTGTTRYVDVDPAPASEVTYRITAEVSGASSASSEPVSITTPASQLDARLVSAGSVWRYLDDGSDPGEAWAEVDFDDASWASGPGPFGFGDGDEATITATGSVTTHFRTAFDVVDPAAWVAVDVFVNADDGAAVQLNGVEVGRVGLPDGPLTIQTGAECCVWGAAEQEHHRIRVPAQLLRAGRNVWAVEVHNLDASNNDLSFDLAAVGVTGGGDVSPPATPVLEVAFADANQVDLSWTAPMDDTGVVGYRVIRDGTIIAVLGADATGLADVDVEPGRTYEYSLVAIDGFGNISAPGLALVEIPEGAVAPEAPLVASGAEWLVGPAGLDLGTGWNGPGFDDATWGEVTTEAGFGDGNEATELESGRASYQFRHRFDAPAEIPNSIQLDLVADDGAAVYLNGTELVRHQLPDGPLASTTKATTWVSGAAERTPVEFQVPAGAMVDGENVLAVSVHNIWAANSDLSFDLEATGRTNEAPPLAVGVDLVARESQWWTTTGPDAPDLEDFTGTRSPAELTASGWTQAAAEFGYGDGDEASPVEEGEPRWLAHWFRHSFEVPERASIESLEVGLVRDDGAAVYLNGVELVRDQLPAGPLDADTLASEYSFGADEREVHRFDVPADALAEGSNVVSVQVHSADRGSKDLSFDLELIGRGQAG